MTTAARRGVEVLRKPRRLLAAASGSILFATGGYAVAALVARPANPAAVPPTSLLGPIPTEGALGVPGAPATRLSQNRPSIAPLYRRSTAAGPGLDRAGARSRR